MIDVFLGISNAAVTYFFVKKIIEQNNISLKEKDMDIVVSILYLLGILIQNLNDK